MSENEKPIQIELELIEDYRIRAHFGIEGMPDLILDEPEPLGGSRGPNPSRMLMAAAAGCLSASLLFCLRKSRVEVKGLRARAEAVLTRNDRGRLRLGGMKVKISPQLEATDRDRLDRCKTLFEDFCVVTQSVRQGIHIEVEVE